MILLATDTPFWQPDTPGGQRVAAMIQAMRAHFPRFAVHFADTIEAPAIEALAAAFPGLSVHDLPQPIKIRRMRRNRFRSIARRLGAHTPPGPLMREQCEHFAGLCARLQPRVILCTAPCLADLIAALPEPRPRTWTDCHGCWALGHAQAPHEVAEAEQERGHIAWFDGVIAPTRTDAETLRRAHPGKTIVVSSPGAETMADILAALEEAR